jgi:hypothetical protein
VNEHTKYLQKCWDQAHAWDETEDVLSGETVEVRQDGAETLVLTPLGWFALTIF